MDYARYVPLVVALADELARVYGENRDAATVKAMKSLLNDFALPLDARDILIGILNSTEFERGLFVNNFKMMALVKTKQVPHSVTIGNVTKEVPIKSGLRQGSNKLISI